MRGAGKVALPWVAAVSVTATGGVGAVHAQDEAAFCGRSGPMIVAAEPLRGDIDTLALAYADSDAAALALLEARGHPNFVNSSDAELLAVVTAFGMPALVSSGAVALRLLGDMNCDGAVVTPID
jgi:hypothetical protein